MWGGREISGKTYGKGYNIVTRGLSLFMSMAGITVLERIFAVPYGFFYVLAS